MSELKARHIVDVYDSYYAEKPFGERSQVYLKSEADKVIALLKDKANYNEYAYKRKSEELADTCRFYEDELRHHKYKRCLAMAKWCRMQDEFIQLESERLGLSQSTLFLEYRMKAMWWNKWRYRWLELANKFNDKETK